MLWEPVAQPVDETLNRAYRFDLVQYLDAIDRAAADRADEGRRRRVARLVRQDLAADEERYGPANGEPTVDWVSGSPWTGSTVRVCLTGPVGQKVHEFGPGPAETDEQCAARIRAQLNRLRWNPASAVD